MIAKVVSGGQTGVDIAALRAAKRCGPDTGGWMPKRWYTLSGQRPEYAAMYGMRECAQPGYAARTELNVIDSHATLRIAVDFSSPGELCTMRAIRRMERPCLDVPLGEDMRPEFDWAARVEWWLLKRGGPVILNVAGNAEQTAPGIEAATEELLVELFTRVSTT